MNFKLHHIGKVSKNIEHEYRIYTNYGFSIAKGFETVKKDVYQKVLVGAIKMNDVYLELLEPLSSNSPIYSFSEKGGGLHHVCYEVENLKSTIDKLKKDSKNKQLTPITTSVWEGRSVVFFWNKLGGIFEIIQP